MLRSFIILSIFLPFLSCQRSFLASDAPKCRALCLEGGGDAGSWQAGVLSGFIKNLPASEVQYDVISGISVGSLNGLFVSTYAKGDEINMIENLLTLWRGLRKENVYKPWHGWYVMMVEAFFNQPSLFDNSPLKETMDEYVKGKTIQRKISIGVTDATNADVLTFDLDTLPMENVTQLILDSTSMPAVFPYQTSNELILMDGGVMINIDVHSAVRRCKELGFEDKDIVIDAILPTGASIDKIYSNVTYTGYDMYKRYKQILEYRAALDDIIHALNDFPNVDFRYIVFPLESIPSFTVPIFFDKDSIEQMISLGEQDAKKVIESKTPIGINDLIQRRYKRKANAFV
jgi:predicted acylesterase/phospholipase RssA